jgi:Asp-tRNA(Asn)/Glu-tRNA(Gln) amidotransferase A subunit family amidase
MYVSAPVQVRTAVEVYLITLTRASMLHRVFGRTDNPWKLSRTPGGSSGGEGAMVASLSSPLGLGMQSLM